MFCVGSQVFRWFAPVARMLLMSDWFGAHPLSSSLAFDLATCPGEKFQIPKARQDGGPQSAMDRGVRFDACRQHQG